ncbi:MAG: V-type ATP synthase subunit D [Actinomycetia bacterium]|nr:V-type ATP synthase subunit D [Actinomycetes bacterium]
MVLKVNPNRMVLLQIKKRNNIAKRGHKLLKDKLDELMKHFLAIIKEIKEKREKAELLLEKAYNLMTISRGILPTAKLREIIDSSKAEIEIGMEEKSILNVSVPSYSLEVKGDLYGYDFLLSPQVFDDAVQSSFDAFKELVELAEIERKAELLANEIERTRRRVNALEYILIPQLEEAVRYITMKLDEMDRESRVRLMKIKEMLEAI